jgi:hypothetical protein
MRLFLALSCVLLLQLFAITCSFVQHRRFCVVNNRNVLYNNDEVASSEDVAVSGASKPISSRGKGFGKVQEPVKVEEEKDIGTLTYERQAKRGVPEYNIFLRPVNGSEAEWLPVGSMTVPRDRSVSVAVFEVEEELLKGAFKLYPKLKAFREFRKDKGNLFEYGYVLKAFPDEPIVVAKRESPAEQSNFFQNW